MKNQKRNMQIKHVSANIGACVLGDLPGRLKPTRPSRRPAATSRINVYMVVRELEGGG
jgi:hypothetical protein